MIGLSKEERKNGLQCFVYLMIYIAFQLVLCIYVMANECGDNYLGVFLLPLLLSVGLIIYTSLKGGNVRLALYVSMLLSIGQLLQAVLQTGDAYLDYQKNFQTFMIIAAVAMVLMVPLYRHFFEYTYTKMFHVVVCAAAIGVPFVLRLFGSRINGAYNWIRIGVFSLQLTEFLKPLLIFAVAGFLCKGKKISNKNLLSAFLFTGFVAALCIYPLNEFGTALVLGFTGILMMYIFQNTKISKLILGVSAAGVLIIVLCFWGGNYLCKNIPLLVSDETFAEQFTCYCEKKGDWADFVDSYTAQMEESERKEKEELMGKTYASISGYVRSNVGNDDICHTYVPDEDLVVTVPNVTAGTCTTIETRRVFMDYMSKLLACDSISEEDKDFRMSYYETFVSGTINRERLMAAYEEWRAAEEPGHGFIKSGPVKTFLEVYLRIAEKIQDKFSGYLNPEGESQDNASHVNECLAAMSTGGLFGNGADIYTGDIYAYDSDMAFGMLVAELGCLMAILVIVLCLLICQEMIFIGMDTPSLYQKGICIGMGVCWAIQALLIVGGNCRIFPFTGITLPLISNGGTSLLVSLLMAFLVILVSIYPVSRKKSKKIYRKRKIKEKEDVKEPDAKEDADSIFDDLDEEDDVKIYNPGTKSYTIPRRKTDQKADTKAEEPAKDDWENPLSGM